VEANRQNAGQSKCWINSALKEIMSFLVDPRFRTANRIPTNGSRCCRCHHRAAACWSIHEPSCWTQESWHPVAATKRGYETW